MRITLWILLFSFTFIAGCTPSGNSLSPDDSNAYARGFTIGYEKGYRQLTVRNPWEKARNVEIKYFLVDKSSVIPEDLKGENIIRTPVERIICLSTSHVAFMDVLGELDKVTAVSGGEYITHPEIRKGLAEGRIADVGYGTNLNYEEIIRQQPDVVMVYGVDSEITGFLNKFSDLGIPAILNAEFLESSPLGKAEWIRFAGALFQKEQLADSLFNGIAERYMNLKTVAGGKQNKPAVMMGLPYRDSWWVPGGDSYMARLIADAGGQYLGSNNSSRESFVISFEEALSWASRADIWLNVGMVSRKDEILALDSRFNRFGVFNTGRIYNNNKRSTGSGGNDFWESGTIAPDRVLEDLIRIFHPGLLPSGTMGYYQEVE